jgi:ABC-type oligopeptide transport system ATPase subunit
MKDRRIVEAGNTGELITNPRHEYTRTLLNCTRQLDFALKKETRP